MKLSNNTKKLTVNIVTLRRYGLVENILKRIYLYCIGKIDFSQLVIPYFECEMIIKIQVKPQKLTQKSKCNLINATFCYCDQKLFFGRFWSRWFGITKEKRLVPIWRLRM